MCIVPLLNISIMLLFADLGSRIAAALHFASTASGVQVVAVAHDAFVRGFRLET
jgi:hypothetical protein